MGRAQGAGTPRWIVITAGVVGLVTAIFIAVAKYHEMSKAWAEAAKAQAELNQGGSKIPGIPVATNRSTAATTTADGGKSPPPPTFQPRSTATISQVVAHGKVEVTAQAVAEHRVIITVIGRNFGQDFSPLQDWLGRTGDLFQRQIQALGLGAGSWQLVSNARAFTVHNGVASLELTWERK